MSVSIPNHPKSLRLYAQFVNDLAALLEGAEFQAPAATPTTVAEVEKTKPEVEKPRKEKAVKKEEKAPEGIDASVVKTALTKLLGEKGPEVVAPLLKEFGAAKFSEIKPDQYAAFLVRIEQTAAQKETPDLTE